MALRPNFTADPNAPLVSNQRWFPATEELRATAYEKLLRPLVAKICEEIKSWRAAGYGGASATSKPLLHWWFELSAALTELRQKRQKGSTMLAFIPHLKEPTQ